MAFNLVSDLFTTIDQVATDFAIENMSNLVNFVTPIVSLGLVLSLLIQGLFIMASPSQGEPLSGLVQRFIRYAIVIAFASAGGFFMTDLANLALDLPDQLSSNIFMDGSSVTSSSMGGVIDNAIEKGSDLAKQSLDNVGLSGDGFAALVVFVHIAFCTFLLCGVGAAFILMAKILLAITVAFGPVFIFALMFDNTKRLFTPWVGSLINYILTVVLISSVFNLMVTFYSNLISNAAENDSTSFVYTIMSSGLLLIVTLLVIFKIPSIASSWSSGVTATVDIVSASHGMRAAKGAGQSVAGGLRAAGGAATRAGGGAVGAMKSAGGAVGQAAAAGLRYARQR